MSLIKWFNNVLFIENLFGIYRNFFSQKKTKKYFIVLHILVQTILQTIIVIREEYFLLGGNEFTQVKFMYGCYSVISFANTVSSVLTGICNNRAFMSYYRSIARVSEFFKADNKLNSSMQKTYWFSIIFTLFCFLFGAYRAVELYFLFSSSQPFYLIPILVSQTIARNTIVFEHLMLFVVIMIVVHLFKCLTSLISAVQERIGSCDISSDEQCDITREKIQEWVELYGDLANCCKKVTAFIGRQFFFSIILSLTHYVLMTYQYFYSKAFYLEDFGECKRIIIGVCSYILLMMLPLVAGQWVRNQGVKFHRVLGRLYNTMIICSDDAEIKLIKDFIRLMKKNPLEIKLLTKSPAGMYMLPVILTLAVNYIIVMLQFNHII